MEVFEIIITYVILAFSIAICSAYVLLGIVSAFQLTYYKRANKQVDYNIILSSPNAPGISVLAPAFNESATIIDNIDALLSLHYKKYEVIVINDGSKDDTLEKVIRQFELEKVDFAVNYKLKCKEIRGVYRSKNRAYKFLTVVDKMNGGKADSLNAGLNISKHPLYVAIDVDCVIEPNALLRMVKPFMEAHKEKVIATGGVIRIANSCHIENGHIINIKIPHNFLAKFQVLEYTRAFLLGRMAWSKLNGLLLISGALGLFDKTVAIECGGYNPSTVGEDMELVVRMRRLMYDKRIKHRVEYIPDPLCWTEVPTTVKTLSRQRSRWTRGTIDSLFYHLKIFFNPKYGSMGLLGYPYWFFFEWLAPIIEVTGYTYLGYLIYTHSVNWPYFGLLFVFAYLFGVSFSIYSILYEELTFHKYKKVTQLLRLFLIAFIEPVSYHYLSVFFSIKGNIAHLFGNKSWGNMEHKSFKELEKTEN